MNAAYITGAADARVIGRLPADELETLAAEYAETVARGERQRERAHAEYRAGYQATVSNPQTRLMAR